MLPLRDCVHMLGQKGGGRAGCKTTRDARVRIFARIPSRIRGVGGGGFSVLATRLGKSNTSGADFKDP